MKTPKTKIAAVFIIMDLTMIKLISYMSKKTIFIIDMKFRRNWVEGLLVLCLDVMIIKTKKHALLKFSRIGKSCINKVKSKSRFWKPSGTATTKMSKILYELKRNSHLEAMYA